MQKNNYTATEIRQLVQQFQARSLPVADWTHEAHLIVALSYLRKYSKMEATCYLRTSIISYHSSQGGTHSKTSGYHETLTLFWIWAVDQFLKSPEAQGLSEAEQVTAFLVSSWADKRLPLVYYSKSHLMSLAARTYWQQPDRKAIPGIFD